MCAGAIMESRGGIHNPGRRCRGPKGLPVRTIALKLLPVPFAGSVGEKWNDSLVKTTKQALLRKAADLVGHDELAKRLNVPRTLLEVWMRGHATMPDRKLLPLADLLEQLGDIARGKQPSPSTPSA